MENIFELPDEQFIQLCHKFIDLREQMKREAEQDAKKVVTPSALAQGMGLPVDQLLELQEFSDNSLGDFEFAFITEHADGFYNLETQQFIQL